MMQLNFLVILKPCSRKAVFSNCFFKISFDRKTCRIHRTRLTEEVQGTDQNCCRADYWHCCWRLKHPSHDLPESRSQQMLSWLWIHHSSADKGIQREMLTFCKLFIFLCSFSLISRASLEIIYLCKFPRNAVDIQEAAELISAFKWTKMREISTLSSRN